MLPRKEIGQRRFFSIRVWTFIAGGMLAFAIIAIIAGKAWLASFLAGGSFRASVSSKAGEKLHAEAEVAPFAMSGWTIHTDGFRARGTRDAFFSELQLEQIRAGLSTPDFRNRAWRIEQASIDRVQIAIDGERVPARSSSDASPASASSHSNSPADGWLPNRLEIGSATVREATLQWKGGGLKGTGLQATPEEGGWKIVGQGGNVAHGDLPPLEIGTLLLSYRKPLLQVQDVELRQSGGGVVRVRGEVRPGDAVDLVAQLDKVSLSPYLAEDWRARVQGKISGDVRVQSPLPLEGSPLLSGTLSISEGQLEALPILNEIATLTRTAQFRRLNLTRASGEFQRDGNRLHVQNFTAEAEGLLRLEGKFTIEHGQIDGDFQVGVNPACLKGLPGFQEHVFTVSRGSYLWTPLRVTGTLEKPIEDLSPRLAAQAKETFLKGIDGTVLEKVETARDAVKSGLDFLLGH